LDRCFHPGKGRKIDQGEIRVKLTQTAFKHIQSVQDSRQGLIEPGSRFFEGLQEILPAPLLAKVFHRAQISP
jgi:hypothetical protein